MVKIEEKVVVEAPKTKSMMDLTLRELQEVGFTLGMLKMDNMAFDAPWDVIIKMVNKLAGSKALRWTNTLEEAMGLLGTFLA